MADYIFGRDTRTQGEVVDRVFVQGEEAEFIFGRGSQIFPNMPVAVYGTTEARMVLESEAYWFEFGFRIDAELSGNAAAGWTDAGNYMRLEVQKSEDLVNWSMGKFLPAPVPVVDLEDGTWEYWGRCIAPEHWEEVMVDLTATTTLLLGGRWLTALADGSLDAVGWRTSRRNWMGACYALRAGLIPAIQAEVAADTGTGHFPEDRAIGAAARCVLNAAGCGDRFSVLDVGGGQNGISFYDYPAARHTSAEVCCFNPRVTGRLRSRAQIVAAMRDTRATGRTSPLPSEAN